MEQAFGPYLLRERIGVGGMGEVYRATKRGPEEFEVEVALKVILPHLAREESFRRRFSQEARVAASLRHPNIVQVNGFDIQNGTPYIEMELVQGVDLASLLKSLGKGKPLPLEEAAFVIHEASRGLAFAHTARPADGSSTGIIHRDFSPHNILVSIEGEVKIADFGIARTPMATTAASGSLMGKLAYMSPEQVEGGDLSHRTDLFSLGTTAYQLLTGHHPFLRSGEAGTLRAVQEAHAKPLSQVSPDLPPALAEMVQSLLSASPEDRPGSALDVALACEPFLRPAAAARLGKRIRTTACPLEPVSSTTACGTAPTIPLQPRKPRSVLFAASIFAASAVLLFLPFMIPPGRREAPAKNQPERMTAIPKENSSLFSQASREIIFPISTQPAGAGIYSGNTLLGLSPMKVAIHSGTGSRRLSLSLEGYEETEVFLSREMKEEELMVPLTPLPTGTLRIGAIPWARVRLRGVEMGITPLVIEETPVGTYDVILSNDELGITRGLTITVQEGSNPAFAVDLATGEIVKSK